MARFKYKGEKPRKGLVKQYGRTKQIRVPHSRGGKTVYNALDQMMGFIPW